MKEILFAQCKQKLNAIIVKIIITFNQFLLSIKLSYVYGLLYLIMISSFLFIVIIKINDLLK